MLQDLPLETWGKNQAKSLDHLWGEIESGEAHLRKRVITGKATWVRVVEGVGAVLWQIPKSDDRSWSFLQETSQTFKDGRVRYRSLGVSIGEKSTKGEDAGATLRRGLEEELGLENFTLNLSTPSTQNTLMASDSYPGTWREYRTQIWHFLLPKQFVREEYVEEQADKTSLFHWRELPYGIQPAAMNATLAVTKEGS